MLSLCDVSSSNPRRVVVVKYICTMYVNLKKDKWKLGLGIQLNGKNELFEGVSWSCMYASNGM